MKLISPIITKKAAQLPVKEQQSSLTTITGFSFLTTCKYWQKIEETTKRLQKLEYLSKLLIRMHVECADDICPLLLLITNKIRQPWDGQTSVLNSGEQTVKKAMQENFNVSAQQLKQDFQKEGDLGVVCMQYKNKQPKMFCKSKQLTISSILKQFQLIGDADGSNSTQQRQDTMRRLLQDCSDLECKYMIRLLLGKNRLGIQRKTILFALSEYVCFVSLLTDKKVKLYNIEDKITDYVQNVWNRITVFAVTNSLIDKLDKQDDEESDSEQDGEDTQRSNSDDQLQLNALTLKELDHLLNKIKKRKISYDELNPRVHSYFVVSKAFARVPSLQFIVQNATVLENTEVTPGVPILPMLAKPTTSFSEVLDKIGGLFACEYKYDGFRAQVHCHNNKMQIYSRSQENMSKQFPDVLTQIKQATLIQDVDFIIDGEIVAVDENGVIQPFQMLARRLKIYDGTAQQSKITMFVFDIMYLRDHCLMDLKFSARRAILHSLLKPNPLVQFAQSVDVADEQQLQSLLNEAVDHKTEGLIVKTLQSHYCPDRRSRHWLKLKKDYLEGVGDSLDLVPIAAWLGKGKRSGVLGAFLLVARNGDNFETVTQIGTGFTDQYLQELTARFADLKLQQKPHNVITTQQYSQADAPDFWIAPESSIVWEIKVANLSLSLAHTCGAQLVKEDGRGVAARLPRLMRERTDKQVSECSTSQFVYECFLRQPDRIGGDGDADECGNDLSED